MHPTCSGQYPTPSHAGGQALFSNINVTRMHCLCRKHWQTVTLIDRDSNSLVTSNTKNIPEAMTTQWKSLKKKLLRT